MNLLMKFVGGAMARGTAAVLVAFVLSLPALAFSPPPAGHPASTAHAPAAVRSAAYPMFSDATLANATGDAAPMVVPPWLEQKLVSSNGAFFDLFGSSVAIDGDVAVIGAGAKTVNGHSSQGAAYVFTLSGGVWTQTAELVASDGAASDRFGYTVALSGNTAIIGAQNATVNGHTVQGKAYVFTNTGGTWTQGQTLTASDGLAGDTFSWAIAVNGTTALLSAEHANTSQGVVYVFANVGGVWTQTQKLAADDGVTKDLFGSGVALDGTTAVIGAPGATIGVNTVQGAAYVFTQTGGTWTQAQKLVASDGLKNDGFGYAVAISGSTALVGDYLSGNGREGSAYVFTASNAVWQQVAKLGASDAIAGDSFGQAVALSGTTALVGAYQMTVAGKTRQGTAYVFAESGGAWTQQQELIGSEGAASDWFGYRVALSGTTALIGANEATVNGVSFEGKAYVYTAPPPVASVTPATLDFTVVTGSTTAGTLSIANGGGADLTFALGEADASCSTPSDVAWLSEAPTSGSVAGGGSQDMTVAVDATNLVPGDYSASICVTTNDSTNSLVQVPVSVTVNPTPPAASITPASLNFVVTAGDTDSNTLAIANGGGANLTFASDEAAANCTEPSDVAWLSEMPINGTVAGSSSQAMTVTVDTSTLSPGDYSALLCVSTNDTANSLVQIAVGLTVNPTPPAANITPASLGFAMVAGSTLSTTLTIANGGGTDLTYAFGEAAASCSSPSDVPWLDETPASGSVAGEGSQDVTVTINTADLNPGNYSALLCVTTNDSSNALIQIPVSLAVSPNDRIFADGFDNSP